MLTPDTLLQNRYRVGRPLGQGGMGAVYEATDERFGRTVAIKQAFFSAAALRRAFEREARLLNDLRHPALPVVIDYFAEGNDWFLVMDYVAGEDLGARLVRLGKPFEVEEVLRWSDQVLDALEYLHAQDPPVVHRDIKPQNLKLTPRGEVKLLDFGLAKGTVTASQPDTGARSVAGYTPHYAPIEQVQGAGTDVRSDLYSLAATVYHLLTGRVPPDALDRAMRQLNGEADPLVRLADANPNVSQDVSEVLWRAMATSANQRPASATAMRRALREASGISWPTTMPTSGIVRPYSTAPTAESNTIVARPAAETSPVRETVGPTEVAARPRRRALWIGAALLALVVAGGGYALVRMFGQRPQTVDRVKAQPPDLKPLKFETLEVDETGGVAARKRAETRYYIEEFGAFEMVEVPAGSFEMGAAEPKTSALREAPSSFRTVAWVAQQPSPAPSAMPRPLPQEPPRPVPRPKRSAMPRPRPLETAPEVQNEPEPKRQTKRRAPKVDRAPDPAVDEPLVDETETPRHLVTVASFFIGRYEVTQAEWRAVVSLPKVDRDLNPDPSEFKGDNLPVDNVSWEDATEFCARLSAKTGRTYRLPTEAEWEYACRAGSAGPFAFGPTITPDLVNYDGNYAFGAGPRGVSRRKTLPVGGLGIANAFGLCDMHGNVWEWCLDVWHPDYTGAPSTGVAWDSGGDPNFRVIRGGSWITGPSDCRSSRRVNNPPGNRNSDVGFRIVMVARR